MLDDTKKRNLKRIGLEMAAANVLVVMAIALANYVDDEDEENVAYPLLLADYFITRVANEQVSGTIALPKAYGDIAENPIMALDRFYDLFNVTDIFDDELVTKGSYANKTKSYKWISQNVVLAREYHRYSDIKSAANTYRHFNSDVYNYTILADWLMTDSQEEDE